MAWCITLSLVAVLILQTQAGIYQVTSDVHPDCTTNVRLQPTSPIQVTRGERGAPCVGYVQYDVGIEGSTDYRRMCSTGDTLFSQPNAQRVCFTLGLNMWRQTNFNDNDDEQIMLYGCDAYTEEDVDYPDSEGSEGVAGLEGTPYNYQADKRCHPQISTPDSFCYDDCHIGGPQTVTSNEVESDCDVLGGPFYAITCSDKDECNNGVLYNCWGPFPENCKRRNACGPNTKCQNEIGSWTCECETGYEPAQGDAGDPYRISVGCKDINECLDPDFCGYLGQCRNTPGSYICVCIYPELWDPTTYKCKQITCNAIPTIPYAAPTTYVTTSPVYNDKVTYTCSHGYKVVHKMIPSYGLTSPYIYTPTYYDPYYWYNNGHRSDTTFELTCTVTGHWGPYPLPSCVRPHCTDPGYIDHAVRSGDDYEYGKEVRYTCKTGYRPYDYHNQDYFVKTCQDDGTWSTGTYCVDIDECSHADYYTCGSKAKYCHNTEGSYRCSCVPYTDSHNNYDTYDCPETKYPDPCEELKRLGLCGHGTCEKVDGHAYCRCYDGYHGSTCDKVWGNTALIIAIVALVLVVIALLILIVFCCCYHNIGGDYGPHVVGGPPVVAPIEPIYGRRKPMLRRNFWHRHF